MRFIKPILKVALAIFLVIGPVWIPTIIGVSAHFLPWREDRFEGKPLSELITYLNKSNRYLTPEGGNSYRFKKGKDFSVGFGSAINIGRVTVGTNGGVEVIRKIEHSSFVDSL